ncbi:MAG TPA: DNA alkylation repair protein [Gemmatimonadaceae bacterium]|nr:DNA alkylation repair protein [Gemmatimonadaceae bacterium]
MPPTDPARTKSTLRSIRASIHAQADRERAVGVARFFKTGPGEYGEGDEFLGLTVAEMRRVVRTHRDLARDDMIALLQSRWHEERAVALLLMVHAHERSTPAERKRLHRAYLANTARVNNWDLVDLSAPRLAGYHVAESGTKTIVRFARSRSLWERRIAIVSTLFTIRAGNFAPTLLMAEMQLDDPHDLIHKASGWMLREVGKRDEATLRAFLDAFAPVMPRTALRYAIERFPESDRKRYLAIPRVRRVRNAKAT